MSRDVTDNLASLMTIFPDAHLLSVPVISRSARFTKKCASPIVDTNTGPRLLGYFLLSVTFCCSAVNDLSIGVPAKHESRRN